MNVIRWAVMGVVLVGFVAIGRSAGKDARDVVDGRIDVEPAPRDPVAEAEDILRRAFGEDL